MNPSNLDIEFLLDKSGSMQTKDCPGGRSRWEYAQETTVALATVAEKYDADGITVVPFAGSFKVHDNVTAAKVAEVFQEHSPLGGTATHLVLKARLDAYLDRKAKGVTKPVLLIVLTDGAPEDQEAVASVIMEASKKLDRDEEVAIQFLQVGLDASASKFLQFLDDELTGRGAKFDIVDTMRISEVENFNMATFIEKSFTALRIALIIANSDGNFADSEKKVFREICGVLGLAAEPYLT